MRQTRLAPVKISIAEAVWEGITALLTAWSLLAVGLAQAGLFRGWALLLAGVLACGAGWVVLRPLKSLRRPTLRRELLFVAMILVAGLFLFNWPAEHVPQMGDSSIYPNTAAMLMRTGGLTYHYDPLDGLTLEQKQLFYVPSDRQLPDVPIQSYKGLLYGAYYVMDPSQNTIVSSRPPLLVAWMGWFGTLFGERGMLYVAPLFGAASLVTVYCLGKRVFEAGTGALAALWLLLSFPQLHFSRAPYAEVVGQFFVLRALYALVTYLQTHRLTYLLPGIAALTAAFATRIDVILALPTLFLFIVALAARRDWSGLFTSVAATTAAVGFTVWTVNRPYLGATAEILLGGQLRLLRQLDPYMMLGLSLGGLLVLALLVLSARRVRTVHWRQSIHWGLLLAVVLGVGYALHVRPLAPEYVMVNGELLPAYSEELMAVTARYVSPLLFWVAALGVAYVLLQRRIPLEQMLLLLFVASFGGVFFWKYTTAAVYPVALRRLVPEVLPGLCLLAAFALRRLGQRPRWRWGATAIAGLMMVLVMSVAAPYWFSREAAGTWDFLDGLAKRLPAEAVVLFEPRQDGSVVGWFAAPLWSFYQRQALLLNSGELDGPALRDAVSYWQSQGRSIYVVSQNDPSTWWPGAFRGRQESGVVWESSIIGQSRRFPPYVWRFAFTFSIYRWNGATGASS
jgi:4-amino-4-deoxy-L-arabinose transferase-like glycosyltransferase